ncbi:MAG: hypothetical protein J7J94_00840 [Thaumarchaeota archaeon]|nr:hypothetical protein [Nitrososphaerota archaeon]
MPLGSILTEAILGVAAIIVASVFAGAYFMGVNQITEAEQLHVNWLKDRLSHDCMILYVKASADSDTVTIWVKNTGERALPRDLIEKSELMIISSSQVRYLLYGSGPGAWSYVLLNDVDSDGRWDRGETIRIDVSLNSTLGREDYQAVFILYNGVKCSLDFTPYS